MVRSVEERQDAGRDLDAPPPTRHRMNHGRGGDPVPSKFGKKFPEIHGVSLRSHAKERHLPWLSMQFSFDYAAVLNALYDAMEGRR